MKFVRSLLLLSFVLLIFFQDAAALQPQQLIQNDEECEDNEEKLKVLTWNIYMLPWMVPGNHKRERAYSIVDEIKKSDFDVIVFQEAFLPAARNIITAGLGELYPFQYGPANQGGFSIRISSGVWVLSKTKLKLLNTVQFKNCARNDCFSRKGAMLLEGEWNGKPFQILGTHLQADGFDKIREKQMDQIYLELLSEYKREGVPQILCGDMNTEKEMHDHYCAMLDCLNAEDGEIGGVEKCSYDGVNNNYAQSFGAKKKVNYDYILVRNNGIKMKSTKRFVSIMKKGRKYLSDHYGVICEMKF